MLVCVTVLVGQDGAKPHVTLSAPPAGDLATLEHEVRLGAGVRMAVDLTMPHQWRRVSLAPWSQLAEPLLAAIIGAEATQKLRVIVTRRLSGNAPTTDERLLVDSTRADPWLRTAVAHALDRWLHLPLEQDLLDAEKGVAMFLAALSLPRDASVREVVINEALGLVRRASTGVSRFLRKLATQNRPIPRPLHSSIRGLVRGYADLAAQISEPDAELSAVLDSWRAVTNWLPVNGDNDRQSELDQGLPRVPVTRRSMARLTSMIDPRHVRARVFGLGDEPRASEILLSRATANGQDAVRVRVAAFRRGVDPEIAQRLMVRLVIRRSGDAHGVAPLTMSTRAATRATRPAFFECTMPLRGSTIEDLRADVFDALYRADFALDDDTDEELLQVRRAVLLLREWREIAALAELRTPVEPARRLRDLAKLLKPGADRARTDEPLFNGGPSTSELLRLAGHADASLLKELRGPSWRPGQASLLAMVHGPGRLLVAELVAVYQRQAT
jgi:hypothetical protein